MSTVTVEEYNHHLEQLIQNPPYSHYDMIFNLANGLFIIEGCVSNFSDAQRYANAYASNEEVWKALKLAE